MQLVRTFPPIADILPPAQRMRLKQLIDLDYCVEVGWQYAD